MVSMSQYNEAGGYERLSLVVMILVSVGSSFRNVDNGGGVLHSSSQCKDEMQGVAAFETVFSCGFVVGPLGEKKSC